MNDDYDIDRDWLIWPSPSDKITLDIEDLSYSVDESAAAIIHAILLLRDTIEKNIKRS